MKTSLSLLVCVAALPLLAPAQTAPAVNLLPGSSGETRGSNTLFEPMPTPAMTLRSAGPRPESNALSGVSLWDGPKREALLENRAPQVMLGSGNVPVSGLFVDVFRVVPDSRNEPSLLEKILGRRNSVVYAAEPENKFSWRNDYLKWGERDTPWSIVSAPPALQPQSVLFRAHY